VILGAVLAFDGAANRGPLPRTGLLLLVIGLVVYFPSFVQGLRVTWRKSKRRAASIVGLVALAQMNASIRNAIQTGRLEELDAAILDAVVFVGLICSITALTDYVIRALQRRRESRTPPKGSVKELREHAAGKDRQWPF
jgi:uncharacterized protein involved in response to NO